MNENKEIRFIDSNYNELFRIKDGESITITAANGEKQDKQCTYIDDYHVRVGGWGFHICEFAERMEYNGSTYRPKDAPSYTLDFLEPDEVFLTFAPKEDEQNRGCIGYVRGYFDNSIEERLQTSWFIENREFYKAHSTPDFKRECDNIINYFRFQAETPILKNRAAMRHAIAGTKIAHDAEAVYAYRITTDERVYFMRCNPSGGQYNVYLYCYDKQALEVYKNQQFVTQHKEALKQDKFFKTENGITEVYYNPDANAGGQLVYNEMSDDLIKEAARQTKTIGAFFDYLSGGCRQYLIDIDTPEFRGNFRSFIDRKPDFEGCTERTAKALKKHVGITPKKSRSREIER